MTAPLVYRNSRNPYYKRDNLHIGFIIPSVLTVSENHCAKPWEPIIDHVGNSDVKKLANLNVNKESCGAAKDVFMDKAVHWITVGIDNRRNTLLKLPGYQPKTQGAALKQWLESNITDENNQIRLQDICAGIPVGLKKIVRLYVDIRLSMYPNEWNSLRNLYGNDSNYYLQQVGICINKSDAKIDRLNWITIGLLRLKFDELLRQTRRILNNNKDAIKLVVEIKKLFWDILLDETPHRADKIRKKLSQLILSVSNTDNNAEGDMDYCDSNSNHEVSDMSNSDSCSGDDTDHSNHDEPDSKVDGKQSVSKERTQYFDEADLQKLAELDYSSKSLDFALGLVQKKIFDWKILFDPDFYQRVISNNDTEVVSNNDTEVVSNNDTEVVSNNDTEVVYAKGLNANLVTRLVEWLTSNESNRTNIMRNAISLVAELIYRRKSDSCKYIPIGTQQIIESYVSTKISSSLKEWDSLLKRHSKCGPISDILEKICQLINGIDKYGNFLSPTARLYWIRIGQLRVRFEQMKRDNAISKKWPLTTQRIELEFEKALKSQTPQNVDRIEKPLKCLAGVLLQPHTNHNNTVCSKTTTAKPHKWLKWLKRGVSLKGAIPNNRENPLALAA